MQEGGRARVGRRAERPFLLPRSMRGRNSPRNSRLAPFFKNTFKTLISSLSPTIWMDYIFGVIIPVIFSFIFIFIFFTALRTILYVHRRAKRGDDILETVVVERQSRQTFPNSPFGQNRFDISRTYSYHPSSQHNVQQERVLSPAHSSCHHHHHHQPNFASLGSVIKMAAKDVKNAFLGTIFGLSFRTTHPCGASHTHSGCHLSNTRHVSYSSPSNGGYQMPAHQLQAWANGTAFSNTAASSNPTLATFSDSALDRHSKPDSSRRNSTHVIISAPPSYNEAVFSSSP